jgi:hypothetical protein
MDSIYSKYYPPKKGRRERCKRSLFAEINTNGSDPYEFQDEPNAKSPKKGRRKYTTREEPKRKSPRKQQKKYTSAEVLRLLESNSQPSSPLESEASQNSVSIDESDPSYHEIDLDSAELITSTPQEDDDDAPPLPAEQRNAPELHDDDAPELHHDDAPELNDDDAPELNDDDDDAPELHYDDAPELHDDDAPDLTDDDAPELTDDDAPELHDDTLDSSFLNTTSSSMYTHSYSFEIFHRMQKFCTKDLI